MERTRNESLLSVFGFLVMVVLVEGSHGEDQEIKFTLCLRLSSDGGLGRGQSWRGPGMKVYSLSPAF